MIHFLPNGRDDFTLGLIEALMKAEEAQQRELPERKRACKVQKERISIKYI